MLKTAFRQNTWDLINQFVKTEFKLKYNNSVLGFVWVLVKPLVIFLILFFVMSRVFPSTSEFFPLYLLLGTIISGHFNEATSAGVNALLNKQGLILKVNFPRYIVVISALLLPVINFLINLSIYFVISITFFQKIPGVIGLAWFLVGYIMIFMLMLGFALFTSIWNVRLRDISSIWELVLQLIFWLTPVFYSVEVIEKKATFAAFLISDLNPVTVFLQAARSGFLYNRIDEPELMLIWLVGASIFAFLGYLYFRKNVKKIAEDF